MSVTSLPFFFLLFATVGLLALTPPRGRKWVLLAASFIFYADAGLASSAILALIVICNYLMLRAVIDAPGEPRKDRLYLIAILFNLTVFCGLKLAFEPAPGVEATAWEWAGLTLGYPLGLSFVILMLHSAISDAHSGKYTPAGNLPTFALFATFFPYLSAGPVERLDNMERQLALPRRPTLEDLSAGMALIALGLTKKLVAANRMKLYVDAVFTAELPQSAPTAVLAIILNAAYIYCDFSGYTDVARGAARCLGIDVRINFDRPFGAASVTEFWRRWHISFSTWLRDYLYMPLAFTFRRIGAAGTMLALLITFAACGFWHRAALTFLLFGLLHGAAMAIEMRFSKPARSAATGRTSRFRTAGAHLYTLVFLAGTIVLFSARDLQQAGAILAGPFTNRLIPSSTEMFAYQGPLMFLLLFVSIATWQLLERWHRRLTVGWTPWFLLTAALMILFLGRTEGAGFVYAQF